MGSVILTSVSVIFVLAGLSPWLTGVLDFGCWFYTNAQCTSLDWDNPGRMFLMFTLSPALVVIGAWLTSI